MGAISPPGNGPVCFSPPAVGVPMGVRVSAPDAERLSVRRGEGGRPGGRYAYASTPASFRTLGVTARADLSGKCVTLSGKCVTDNVRARKLRYR